jgi:hypothetical protein
MTDQEILDNAPKGATHVMGGNCYCIENTGDDYSEDGYDYLTFRNEDTSGRHRSLADIAKIAELEKENHKLTERCKPSKVVLIGGTGHYVSEQE